MRMSRSGFTPQECTQQPIGFGELSVIFHAHLAYIGRQVADAAGQKFATHLRSDALCFKVAANQVGFGGVLRGVEEFHGRIEW